MCETRERMEELIKSERIMSYYENDDGIDREVSAHEVVDYYKRLEDIDESFVEKYVDQILTGFLWDDTGAKRINQRLQTFDLWEDEEGYVSPTDVLIEEEDFTLDEIAEAKQKLPYLLKVLHDGSIKYKGSLLSFIIAVERYRLNAGGKSIKPHNICKEGVYRVDSNGNITEPFTIEDNSATTLRTLIDWVLGGIDDRYYRASRELLRVCTILDLDITKEDPKVYNSKVIESAVCLYITSNEEYLENYGYANRDILKALSPEDIHSMSQSLQADFSVYHEEFSVFNLIQDIAASVAILKVKNYHVWKDRPKEVVKFLSYYKENIDNSITDNIRAYTVSNNVLCVHGDEPLLIDMQCVRPGEIAVLSSTGHLICYEQFSSTHFKYMAVSNFIAAHRNRSLHAWQVTNI